MGKFKQISEEKSLVEYKKGELIVPKIEVSDITTLIDVETGLRYLEDNVNGKYYTALEKFVRDRIKRIRKRNWLFQTHEYDYLDENFFKDGENKINSQLIPRLFPKELYEIVDIYKRVKIVNEDEDYIKRVNKQLRKISEENNIFLKYFFLTPVNEANWERFLREIVPVTESSSILFGLYEETRVKPFEKTGHEKSAGQMENMQMIPFALKQLKQEYIGFHIGKILSATQDYNTEIKRFVRMLSKFKRKETSLPDYLREETLPLDHLEMDVKIMNYCLENLVKKPYSPTTGAFAIQFGTAVSRIGKQLEKITKKLEDAALSFLESKKRKRPKDNLVCTAERLGFKVKWKQDALRKIEDAIK